MSIVISPEKEQQNKARYIELVSSITRQGANIPRLLTWLEASDFFYAPASAKYHGAIRGGLCQHSLNVYDNLLMLRKDWGMESIISDDTVKIVALFHDFAKVNFYTMEYKNKKIYSEKGKKHDECGSFDWVTVPGYGYIDEASRFLYGNHETTSEYMARQFVPLDYVESIAINHHHGGMSFDSAKDNMGSIWTRYPLALLLYMADSVSAFFNENDATAYTRVKEIVNGQDSESTTPEVGNYDSVME